MPKFLSIPRSMPISSRSCGGWRRAVSLLPMLLLGMTIGVGRVEAQAAQPTAPADAPPELLQALTQIDAAASQGKLQEVMMFYSPDFKNADGLTYATLQDALKRLWQQYPNLTYKTQLNSWQSDGNAIVAETTTTIATAPAQAPTQRSTRLQRGARTERLTATITSRQRFENQRIVQQEILAERSQLSSGEKPPTVTVNLPEQVRIGQAYEFDAVVAEPLGDRLLLGAAMEEPIQASGYLQSTPVELELLSSGGLFKVGRAPIKPESLWVSGVIIRDGGMTSVSQRLQIVPLTASPTRPIAPSR